MPTIEVVKEYIKKLPEFQTERFTIREESEQERIIFSATETLGDVYDHSLLSPRAIALQTLYMIEGEEEEYARMKRHGATSLNAGGTSVSLSEVGQIDIAPSVKAMLGGQPKQNGTGTVARLI